MAASKLYAEKRLRKMKSELEVRYPPTPTCNCRMKGVIKVVESMNKTSNRLLYYTCSSSNCGFFRWVCPIEAKWEFVVEEGSNVKAFEVCEDECEGPNASNVSEIVASKEGRENLNLLVIRMGLFLLLVIILLK